jgi:hypothetical protein
MSRIDFTKPLIQQIADLRPTSDRYDFRLARGHHGYTITTFDKSLGYMNRDAKQYFGISGGDGLSIIVNGHTGLLLRILGLDFRLAIGIPTCKKKDPIQEWTRLAQTGKLYTDGDQCFQRTHTAYHSETYVASRGVTPMEHQDLVGSAADAGLVPCVLDDPSLIVYPLKSGLDCVMVARQIIFI